MDQPANYSGREPVWSLDLVLKNEWAPRLTVIAAALAAFALVGGEYFKAYGHVGWRQVMAVAGCGAVMLAGAAWEVRLGRRALAEAAQFWTVAGFVSLLAIACATFQIENRAFFEFVMPVTVFGFIIHHHLPTAFRKPFFLFLSAVVIAGVFGATSPPAALGLALAALALIGICHLPVPMWARIALLAACAAGLAELRLGWMFQPWIAAFLPILASIFMFRLAVYLYDISHGKGPKDLWGRLGYFFMFPNMVFPFFPVVDFSTFGRTYYNEEALRIYRRGASYMLRGVAHLVLYRVVYMYLVLAPDQIHDTTTFIQYIVANFGLYLKVSGLFHLIVGLLLLFGFNLPETHTRFYFSNSFTDFWRRINIYWKDFMQKMVFNPSYMQFKKFGVPHTASVALSMFVVFLGTWALHAYQWFWITGTFLLKLTDMLFWAVLAGLLIGQTLLEARRKPAQASALAILGPRTVLVARTVSTFLCICLLWSFWTSQRVEDWTGIVARSGLTPAFAEPATADMGAWIRTLFAVALVVAMAAIAMGMTFGLAKPTPPPARRLARPQERNFYLSIGLGAAAVSLVVALQFLGSSGKLGAGAKVFAENVGAAQLNRADRSALTRGYYEDLAGEGTNLNRTNPELLEMFTARNRIDETALRDRHDPGIRFRTDYLWREFIPNSRAHYAQSPTWYQINRWGMADRDYTLEKPAGAYRIVMIGASRAQGLGVDYTERFETLLENRLNQEQAGRTHQKYEILDLGLPSYSPVQKLMTLEEKGLKFQPDAVIYEAGLLESWVTMHGRLIRGGVTMPYGFLDYINHKAGVTRSMTQSEIERRLEPYGIEIASQAYRQIVATAKARGIPAIWVHIPDPGELPKDNTAAERAAREAGFIVMALDDDYDARAYQQSTTDGHPNAEGNRVIADEIYRRLLQLQAAKRIDMGLSSGPAQAPAKAKE